MISDVFFGTEKSISLYPISSPGYVNSLRRTALEELLQEIPIEAILSTRIPSSGDYRSEIAVNHRILREILPHVRARPKKPEQENLLRAEMETQGNKAQSILQSEVIQAIDNSNNSKVIIFSIGSGSGRFESRLKRTLGLRFPDREIEIIGVDPYAVDPLIPTLDISLKSGERFFDALKLDPNNYNIIIGLWSLHHFADRNFSDFQYCLSGVTNFFIEEPTSVRDNLNPYTRTAKLAFDALSNSIFNPDWIELTEQYPDSFRVLYPTLEELFQLTTKLHIIPDSYPMTVIISL